MGKPTLCPVPEEKQLQTVGWVQVHADGPSDTLVTCREKTSISPCWPTEAPLGNRPPSAAAASRIRGTPCRRVTTAAGTRVAKQRDAASLEDRLGRRRKGEGIQERGSSGPSRFHSGRTSSLTISNLLELAQRNQIGARG